MNFLKKTLYTKQYNNFFDNFPIGFEKFWVGSTPINYIAEQGQILSRIEYKDLFYYAETNGLIISEEDWQNHNLYGLFSYSDSDDTFRMRDMRGLSLVGYEEGYHSKIGQYIQDQIVNITGNVTAAKGAYNNGGSATGAFFDGGFTAQVGSSGSPINKYAIGIDVSRVVKTGARVQSRGVTGNWIIKYR